MRIQARLIILAILSFKPHKKRMAADQIGKAKEQKIKQR